MKVVQRAIVVTKDVAGLFLLFLLSFSSKVCFSSSFSFSLCVFDLSCVCLAMEKGSHGKCFWEKKLGVGNVKRGGGSSGS
jgi:hypothetical protein